MIRERVRGINPKGPIDRAEHMGHAIRSVADLFRKAYQSEHQVAPRLCVGFCPKCHTRQRLRATARVVWSILDRGATLTPLCEFVLLGRRRGGGRAKYLGLSAHRCRQRFECSVIRYAVQPITNSFPSGQAMPLMGKNEERGLECIFCIVYVSEHLPTHAQDHGAITLDKNGKCLLSTVVEQPGEQLPIASFGRTLRLIRPRSRRNTAVESDVAVSLLVD